jgi:hypothetical protein
MKIIRKFYEEEIEIKEDLWYRGSNRSSALILVQGDSFNTTEQYGPGLYFSNRYTTAKVYGKVSTYRISSKKMYTSGDRIDLRKIQKLIEELDSESLQMVLSDWDEQYETKPFIAIRKLVDSIKDYCVDMPDALSQVAHDVYHDNSISFLNTCKNLGIDGVIIKDVNSQDKKEKFLVLYNMNIAKPV